MLAVLDRIVEVTQHDTDAVLVGDVQWEELDHVEVFDLDGWQIEVAGSVKRRVPVETDSLAGVRDIT